VAPIQLGASQIALRFHRVGCKANAVAVALGTGGTLSITYVGSAGGSTPSNPLPSGQEDRLTRFNRKLRIRGTARPQIGETDMDSEQYARVRQATAKTAAALLELDRQVGTREAYARIQAIASTFWTDAFPDGKRNGLGIRTFLDLSGADLPREVFSLISPGFLKGANFSSANLQDSSWTSCSVRRANFTNANLRGLHGLPLFVGGTNFSGADLSGSTLVLLCDEDTVDFRGANLTGASMDLSDAGHFSVTGAQLAGLQVKFTSYHGTETSAQRAARKKDFLSSLSPEQRAQVSVDGQPATAAKPTATKPPALAAKSGCFIATACCGSYDAPEVRILRRFRDESLLPSRAGRLLVAAYYRVSPPIARILERHERLRALVRAGFVGPLVAAVGREAERLRG
jgi:uncharacterized protein YjbI with pentapeptide repeats